MKLANKIQFELMKFATGSGYEIVIPNFYYGRYEMDLFRLTNSGIVYEYEIKISRSDFFADFKKGSGECHGNLLFSKHDNLKAAKDCSCNRFFFVVPDGLISIEEVPKYAGLIYFRNDWFSIAKNAPLLKKKSTINYESLAKSLAFREQIIRRKSNYWKRNYEILYKNSLTPI